MTDLLAAAATALWFGLLTAISPCPLATNIAATTVLARRFGNTRRAAVGVVAYPLGRVGAYSLLAGVLFFGLASMPALSAFLRHEVLPLVGPILILAGMAVLGWLPLPFNWKLGSADTADRISKWGITGEFALGGLFALSFCPVSAALFFGSLIPLAAASSLSFLAVILFGIGTALPVGILSLLAIFSVEKAGRFILRVQQLQAGALVLTGTGLIAVGIWLTLTDTIHLL